MRDQNIIVTGASGRLGSLLATHLQESGAHVAAISSKRLPYRLSSSNSRAYSADIVDEDSVSACARQIDTDFGRIDGLVHAAGAWSATPIASTSLRDWEALLRVNLVSTFLWFREAAALMHDGGRLIAFASAQGADRAAEDQSAYSASKAGVIRIVEAAGTEFAPRRITAHAIAPSIIDFGGGDEGVPATDLLALCDHLLSPAGAALNGTVVRAYG